MGTARVFLLGVGRAPIDFLEKKSKLKKRKGLENRN
jgi:hypothetical protein